MNVDVATSQSDVAAAETAKTGYWSEWINGDQIPEHGTGEFENCERIHYVQDKVKKCYLGCESPIAVRYSLNDETKATWSDIGMYTVSKNKERQNVFVILSINLVSF